ncbi:hypothetical protein J6590_089911 [Homalodisca vitripennis]|nr:hypothetical protein J6590_089911 [Homalodisca vitripennis]
MLYLSLSHKSATTAICMTFTSTHVSFYVPIVEQVDKDEKLRLKEKNYRLERINPSELTAQERRAQTSHTRTRESEAIPRNSTSAFLAILYVASDTKRIARHYIILVRLEVPIAERAETLDVASELEITQAISKIDGSNTFLCCFYTGKNLKRCLNLRPDVDIDRRRPLLPNLTHPEYPINPEAAQRFFLQD